MKKLGGKYPKLSEQSAKKKLVRVSFDSGDELKRFTNNYFSKGDIINVESKRFPSPRLTVTAYAGGEALKAVRKHNEKENREMKITSYLITGFLLLIMLLFYLYRKLALLF